MLNYNTPRHYPVVTFSCVNYETTLLSFVICHSVIGLDESYGINVSKHSNDIVQAME